MTLKPKDSVSNKFIHTGSGGIKWNQIKVFIGFVNCHLMLGINHDEKRVYLSKTRTYPSDEPTAIHEGIKGLIDMAVTAAVDSELVVLINTSLLQFGRSHL